MTSVTDGGRAVDIALLPEPKSVCFTGGTVLLPVHGLVAQTDAVAAVDKDSLVARTLLRVLEERAGLVWDLRRSDATDCLIDLGIDAEAAPQSYVLAVSEGDDGPMVRITGGDLDGLRYGVATLAQLLGTVGAALPVGVIEDAPAFPVRGYYLDLTRGRVPDLTHLKAWVDRLAACKYNQLHLYVEHVFAFRGLAQAWRGSGALSADEIMELDGYCADRGIELVPSISTFGHQYMTLRTDAYRDLGEFPEDADRPFSFVERMEHHTFNPLEPGALGLVERMIDEYAPLFRSRRFNLCADETFDLGRGRSRAKTGEIGVGTLYADYLESLCEHLVDKGLQPMMWADIAVNHPEALGRLAGRGILLNWQYEPDVMEDRTAQIAESGATQYVCPAVHCWNSLAPRLDDAWENITRMARYGLTNHAEGLLITDWGDFGHINDLLMSVPGMCYGAQCGWNGGDVDRDATERAIDRIMYGGADGFVHDLAALEPCTTFGWPDAVRYVELAADASRRHDANGPLNVDLAVSSDYWAATADQGAARIADAADAGEGRRRYLDTIADRVLGTGRCDAIAETGRRLSVDLAAMHGAFGGDDSTSGHGSGLARTVMLAVEGIRLFDLAGLHLLAAYGIRADETVRALAEAGCGDASETAEALDCWFEAYARRWRETSHEAELRRIADVVWTLADALRKHGGLAPA